jgi:hypothetical protein
MSKSLLIVAIEVDHQLLSPWYMLDTMASRAFPSPSAHAIKFL